MREPYQSVIDAYRGELKSLGLTSVRTEDDSVTFSDGTRSIEFVVERHDPLSMMITIVDSYGSRRSLALLEDALDPSFALDVRQRLNVVEASHNLKQKSIGSLLVDPGLVAYIDLTIHTTVDFVAEYFHQLFDMSAATKIAYDASARDALKRFGLTSLIE